MTPALDARLAALEQQVQDLRRSLETLAQSGPRAASAERLDDLDRQIRALAQQLEADRQRARAASTQAPGVRAGRDGFQLTAPDDGFMLKLRGYVQSDARFYPDAAASGTFLLRRVRPILEGTLFRQFDFKLMPDFGGGQAVVYDAYVDARFTRAFGLRAGKMKPPIGLERLTSATALMFVERALPSAVAPNRDVGLLAHGEFLGGALAYQAGVFNGVPDGAMGDSDDGSGKDVVGRVFVQPFLRGAGAFAGLGFGVAGSNGLQRGTIAGPALATYKTSGQQTFFRYRTDGMEAGTAVADGNRARLAAQAFYYRGPFGFVAENVQSSQRVRRGPASAIVDARAWQAAGAWVITGEPATSTGVSPRQPFDSRARTWGAIELTARIHGLSVDRGAFPLFADPVVASRSARAWAAGANWYLNTGVKWSLDFERTAFEGGAPVGDRPVEHDVFTRVQIAF